MKKNRFLALALCLALALSMISTAGFAEEANENDPAAPYTGPVGNITAKLHFDYPQTVENVAARDIKVTLYKDGAPYGHTYYNDNDTTDNATLTPENTEGQPLTAETEIGYLKADFTKLPADGSVYSLVFSGDGYKNGEISGIKLQNFSREAIISTGGRSFSLGDINGDKVVDETDIAYMEQHVGKADPESLKRADLNGDGLVDIVDLAYVRHQVANEKDLSIEPYEIKETALIIQNVVKTEELKNEIAESVDVVGNIENIFTESNTDAISLNPKKAGETIALPISFAEPVEMEQIEIASPAGNGAIEGGSAVVVYDDGTGADKEATVSFGDGAAAAMGLDDEADPEILPMSAVVMAADTTSKVVINLGRRVAVKKVTINVEKVQGEDGKARYASVQEVKFLKDIVPENPVLQNAAVQNVSAEAMDESVKLTWNEYPNITGYIVYYGEKADDLKDQVSFGTNEGVVDGLENLTTYYFAVTAVSDGWESQRSEIVSATPHPDGPPEFQPDMVVVKPGNKSLEISWKKTDDATFYKVYYKKLAPPLTGDRPTYKNTDELIKNGYTVYGEGEGTEIADTKVVITGLENTSEAAPLEYSIFVAAGNIHGLSPLSIEAIGTPEEPDIAFPKEMPEFNRLKTKDIVEKVYLGGGGYDTSLYVGPNGENTFDPWFMADEDPLTFWQNNNHWWDHGGAAFEFKQPQDMNYLVYVPRLDGNYRNYFRQYRVWVWNEEDYNKAKAINPDYPAKAKNTATSFIEGSVSAAERSLGYMVLPFERTEAKMIMVDMEQTNYDTLTLTDVFFYKADDLAERVNALFGDPAYTTLSASALADANKTRTEITKLIADVKDTRGYYVDRSTLLDELELAQKLLDKDENALGLIKTGFTSRSAGKDGEKYKQSASDLQPLGIVSWAASDATRSDRGGLSDGALTIYADIPEGETVSIVGTQFYAEANAWQTPDIVLRPGRNRILFPTLGSTSTERGGSVYLRYSGDKADQIKLHIRGENIRVIPMLQLEDWYEISDDVRKSRIKTYVEELNDYAGTNLNANINWQYRELRIYNSTEISLPSVLLSVPAVQVLNAIKPQKATNEQAETALYNNVLAWEEFMHVCNAVQGIDETAVLDGKAKPNEMQSRQNIRYMRMFGNAFMYAAGAHIGIGYGSVGGVVTATPTSMLDAAAESNNLFGWGIAHEVGHNMDKIGRAELTNNIYSIIVQTWDGKQGTLKSRLETSDVYPKIYSKVAAGRPGAANNVFVQLGMYWQLHLAYDDQDPLGFYNKFFTKWKNGDYGEYTADERIALIASEVADKNLLDFFESWGMRLGDAAKELIKKHSEETRNIKYLNDESRRYRLSGGEKGAGKTTASVKLAKDLTDAEIEALVAEVEDEEEAEALRAELTDKDKGEKIAVINFSNDGEAVLGYEISRNGSAIDFVTGNSYIDRIGSANNMAFEYKVKTVDLLGNTVYTVTAGQIRVSYVNTLDKSLYTETANEDGSVTFTLNKQTALSGIKVTGAPAEGEYKVTVTREVEVELVQPDEGAEEAPTEPQTQIITETHVAKNGNFSEPSDVEGSYVAYFNKPGAAADDTRIWTYDAKTVTVTGLTGGATAELVTYAGDNISFHSDATVGRLSDDYVYGDAELGEIIPAGTLVIVGEYRGDPVYNTIQIDGRFETGDKSKDEGEEYLERALAGYTLLFAEIPADGEVSDISDGLFIFVPDTQQEAELQNKDCTSCNGASLLPAQIKATIYRTDDPENTESKRVTSDTVWIDAPSDEGMPTVVLESPSDNNSEEAQH